MRNDASLQARTSRTGFSTSFLPASIRAICNSVSVNASNLTATVHSARSSLSSTISGVEEERQREQVQWANFDKLDSGADVIRHVLLLTYVNGFQVWDVEKADDIRELVSKRDGPVAFLRVQPQPFIEASEGVLKPARPLLLVVTSASSVPGGTSNVENELRSSSSLGANQFAPTIIKFYSLRSHTYVHTLRFPSSIYAVRCSPRVVAVALISQLYCFDPATLRNTFSVLTYPSPQAGVNGLNVGYGAVAVGPRWLAYAANQPLIPNTGRVFPQHLSPSPGIRPSTSRANGSLVVHYAKESSKQIAAGIVTLKDIGYKRWSKYFSEQLTDGAGSPVWGSPGWKTDCNGSLPYPHDPEHAGTVIVQDFVNKNVMAQFRAHESPLSALCFDPSGTLLVTASIHGHNVKVFRIMPTSNGSGSSSAANFDTHSSHVHLYNLSRGWRDALIQDITFTEDSHWIVVSSSRGTSHLFAISPFGGTVGISTHGAVPVNQAAGKMVSMPTFPWWSNPGPVKSIQQSSLPPPLTVDLPVVSRIKNGSNGWCGALSGGASASNGRTSSSFGAIAVLFHDGGGKNLPSETGQNSLEQQLWVFSPSGHLTRHMLHLPAGLEGLYIIPSGIGVGAPYNKDAACLRMVVQESQRWDVCRRSNWVEREERMDNVIAPDAAQDEAHNVGFLRYGNGTTVGWCSQNGRHGQEEMHQLFISNAEVQSHHSREPIWTKSQVNFHVFIGTVKNELLEKGGFRGEKEIEKVPTRMVTVRKKKLVPVFDSLNDVHCGEGHRDVNLPLNDTVKLRDLQLQLVRDDCLQDGLVGTNFIGVQVQHSRSGMCHGSERTSSTGPNKGQNGYHPLYRDGSQGPQTSSLPHYLKQSTSLLHQTQQSQFHLEKTNLHSATASTSDSIKDMKHAFSGSLIGSPPVNIPKPGHQGAYEMAWGPGENPGVDDDVTVEDVHKKITLPLNGAVEVPFVKTKHISIMSIACEGQIKAGSSPHSYSTRNDFGPSVNATSNQCDVSAMVGPDLQLTQSESSGNSKDASGMASNAILNHAREHHLQHYDVETPHANSRSADFEGEQGHDAWERIPFSQDG